jgi:hypothetical protein
MLANILLSLFLLHYGSPVTFASATFLLPSVSCHSGSPLGAAVGGPKPASKTCRLVPIMLQAVPPRWSIFLLSPSLRALIRFSFAIYSFPCVDRRPGFDGFHVLSTDRPQICLRIHLRIGLAVLETSNILRRLAARLCRSLPSVYGGRTGVDG